MSKDDKKPFQKDNSSSCLSENESENSSNSNEYSNQKNPKEQSRILEPDSNSNFLQLNNRSTNISLSSIVENDNTKNFEKFLVDNTKSDMKILSPIPDKNEGESLEDESIQDLAYIVQENDIDLNIKVEEVEKESLKMLGKKRKKSHNPQIDSDSDSL